jgi:8-oxo-dGTP diphosphatase
MPLARFVAFHDVPAALPPGFAPLTFAVTLAHGPAGIVLVHNRRRQLWELPGGLIDAGETPPEAARRELAEEAGCEAQQLEWLGVVEVDDGRRHHGAVFRCPVSTVPVASINEEIDGIGAWRPDAAPEPLGAADRALLLRFGSTGPFTRR